MRIAASKRIWHPEQGTDLPNLYDGDVFYYSCIGEREALLPAYQAIEAAGCFTCTLQKDIYMPEHWLEVMPREATKAHAAQRLKAMLGFERMVCFGDAINDLPLFHAADACYAVRGAAPALKHAATGTIGANDEDAVALFLQANLE